MTQTPPKYYVRFSDKNDTQKILNFYDVNRHKSVRKREENLLREKIESGSVTLIESENGDIVATSITYAHMGTGKNGAETVMWQEFGSTRITLNGYPGLFDAMVTMQALRCFLVEPPADRFVAQMHTAPVQHMASKLGWRGFTPDPQLMALKGATVDKSDPSNALDKNWFCAGVEALSVMAGWAKKAIDDPVLTNRKTGDQIQLDFSRSNFFVMFKNEILNLSNKNMGNVDKPDFNRGMKERRDAWMGKFFR